MLEKNSVSFSRVKEFVEPYTKPFDDSKTDIVDLENPPPSNGADLPCVAAVEFLADIYEGEGGPSLAKAVEVNYFPLSCWLLLTACVALEVLG
jgi:protein farnesyltransferase/geranylgeranyltransferase type-1 subunit alpha